MNISKILEIGNPKKYNFHAARNNRKHEPLDVFLDDREEWHNWNRWQRDKNEFTRDYVISFIQFYPEGKKIWLFGGIYKILGRESKKQAHSYKIELTNQGENLIGRLKVTASIPRGRAFNLETVYDRLSVCEVLREPYNGEVFCGYENVSEDFSTLEIIYKNQRRDWKDSLERVKGVYVIVDKKTGKKYVGSASGEKGIWSRWSQYMDTGHGWNKELVGLLKNADMKKYARKNFRITLIECWLLKTDDNTITQRESFWKKALLTRGKHGYNAN